MRSHIEIVNTVAHKNHVDNKLLIQLASPIIHTIACNFQSSDKELLSTIINSLRENTHYQDQIIDTVENEIYQKYENNEELGSQLQQLVENRSVLYTLINQLAQYYLTIANRRITKMEKRAQKLESIKQKEEVTSNLYKITSCNQISPIKNNKQKVKSSKQDLNSIFTKNLKKNKTNPLKRSPDEIITLFSTDTRFKPNEAQTLAAKSLFKGTQIEVNKKDRSTQYTSEILINLALLRGVVDLYRQTECPSLNELNNSIFNTPLKLNYLIKNTTFYHIMRTLYIKFDNKAFDTLDTFFSHDLFLLIYNDILFNQYNIYKPIIFNQALSLCTSNPSWSIDTALQYLLCQRFDYSQEKYLNSLEAILASLEKKIIIYFANDQ
jgi:hypothetical protein